jgi:iron(II)-dependent oxidoreductase
MTDPALLGALADLHELLRTLVKGQDQPNRVWDPGLGCLGWQLGAAVYRETYWLRERIEGDAGLTERVRHLFPDPWASAPAGDAEQVCAGLPPGEHLLAWAAEIQHEHLRRLATPGALPDHPLLAGGRLPWLLLQENALAYERMLALLLRRSIAAGPGDWRASAPPRPSAAAPELVQLTQGHYRIGSRDDPFAYDNELPPQAVELSSFRIAVHPATNAQYLAFMESGGYLDRTLWDDPGRTWLEGRDPAALKPLGWCRDGGGAWCRMGLNGPAELPAGEPVGGICRHEALAFAAWAARLGGIQAGAVLQHEYQWEIAARAGRIEGTGLVREWCANPFHPYPGFAPFPDPGASALGFERDEGVMRGACLHTQRCLRRASFRHHRPPDERCGFAGLRLVYPPSH